MAMGNKTDRFITFFLVGIVIGLGWAYLHKLGLSAYIVIPGFIASIILAVVGLSCFMINNRDDD